MRCPRCGWNVGPEKGFMKDVTKAYSKAFKPWSPEDDQALVDGAREAVDIVSLAKQLQRQPTAILRRAEKLGLVLTPSKQPQPKIPTEAFAEDERKAMEEK